jgi:hypothetical protein
MPKQAAALAVAAFVALGAPPLSAQEGAEPPPSAEEMIEVARELYRPSGLRERCSAPAPGEIVVCAPTSDEFRVTSPTDDAIDAGKAVAGGSPRAPDLFGIPHGVTVATGCFIPPCPPPMPPLIDLKAIPEPLTREEARHVFRAEDAPNPAAASPAELP